MVVEKLDKRAFRNMVSRGSQDFLEISEHCEQCNDICDISELNLATGVCFRCKPSKFKKGEIDRVVEKIKRGEL